MVNITKERLIDAIVSVIGPDRFAVYGEDGLVTAHQVACLHAFRKNLAGAEVEILRKAYDHLERTGRYPFFPDHEVDVPPSA